MQHPDLSAITTDIIRLPLAEDKGIDAAVLRLDKIHPVISGNKFFKLRYYFEEAEKLGKKHILTFGGAWSNHIVATAAACKMKDLQCTGIIRGERPPVLSPTLATSVEYGMELVFTSREEFSEAKRNIQEVPADSYIIHEGGYGVQGAKGAATILENYDASSFTHICCAAGTGTMTAGLLKAALPHQQVISVSVLKNNIQLEEDIISLAGDNNKQLAIVNDYHFGGYAKYTTALIEFMNNFYLHTSIPSDFVYTGKLFFAINDLVKEKFFPSGSKLLLIHSGGLQGNASLEKGTLIF